MAVDTAKDLLSLECDSLVAYQRDKNAHLDSISFQTTQMRVVFSRHPEVVLIHRAHITWEKALYVFMVDGPSLTLEGEMAKVIHFAVPAKESVRGLDHVYRTFKAFNPEWKQIKTLLVDPCFQLLPRLQLAFPSADIQLSAFHICKHLQQLIRHISLELQTKKLLLGGLRIAMCAPSKANLGKMHGILSNFAKPNLLPQPYTNWLLDEKAWSVHRRRTWEECSQYFQDLEVITHNLSQVFSTGLSLESCIISIAKNYQRKALKGSWEAGPGPGLLSQNVPPLVVLGAPAARAQRPLLPRWPPTAAPQSPPGAKQEASAKDAAASERLRQSLCDICTEPATRLCLNEFAVAQSSECLMGGGVGTVSVQVLEDAQTVSHRSPHGCTCHFSRTFQLPCRHSVALLNYEGKELEPESVPEQWRKGPGASQPGQRNASDLSDVLRSSWDASLDKYLAVSFLTEEICRLLSQCSGEEFDRRYSTLRELADSWIGPYMQVKL